MKESANKLWALTLEKKFLHGCVATAIEPQLCGLLTASQAEADL